MQGVPGSGKSHWARTFIKNNSKNWVIINRDSIRDMLGNYWVPSREKLVTAIEYSNISLAFGLGYNVIVDATNLNPGTISKLKDIVKYLTEERELNITIEFKEFSIPLWKAIFRDWKRGLFGGRRVGSSVIRDFYNKYYANNKTSTDRTE